MTMCEDNILVVGYLREYEDEHSTLQIPNLVTSVISMYCKTCIVTTIGPMYQNSHNVEITFPNIYNKRLIQYQQQIDHVIGQTDPVIDIQSGENHTLLLTKKGNVYGVGSNKASQLGLGVHVPFTHTPTLIPFEGKITAIATGKFHSLFINSDHKLLVCGYNYCGQLGLNLEQMQYYNTESYSDASDSDDDFSDDDFSDFQLDNLHVHTPVIHPYFDSKNIKCIDIGCGTYHSLCITADGECFTFGQNYFGNLGNGQQSEFGTGSSAPYKLEMDVTFTSGLCGRNHNILLTKDNDLVVFGDNSKQQCSVANKVQFVHPTVLSKKKEFGVSDKAFIEKVISVQNESLFKPIYFIIDVYKRKY